jgi:hypothetical protein
MQFLSAVRLKNKQVSQSKWTLDGEKGVMDVVRYGGEVVGGLLLW